MKFAIVFIPGLHDGSFDDPAHWRVAVAYFEDGELQDTWSVVGTAWRQLEAVKTSFLSRFPEHVFQTAAFVAVKPTKPATAYGLGRLFGALGAHLALHEVVTQPCYAFCSTSNCWCDGSALPKEEHVKSRIVRGLNLDARYIPAKAAERMAVQLGELYWK